MLRQHGRHALRISPIRSVARGAMTASMHHASMAIPLTAAPTPRWPA